MKTEACIAPAPQNTVHVQTGERRLDSVPLYLIQRFLERFDLPDRNQQILKLIGIRHFFYVLTGRGRQRRKMTFQSVLYSFLQLFNEFSFALSYSLSSALSFALSYPYSSALSHTLSPEFFLPRIKSFRIHSNSSFQSRIFRKIYADSRFRQDNIPEPLQKKAAQFRYTGGLRGLLSAVTGSSHARMKAEACTSPAKHSTRPSWGKTVRQRASLSHPELPGAF